jgi:hypothetical protein
MNSEQAQRKQKRCLVKGKNRLKATVKEENRQPSSIKVSENGRYFVSSESKPVFWLGTTQWQIFREHSLAEVKLILEKTKKNGFSFIQAMLLGVGDGTKPNVHGETPWKNSDPAAPNEAFFEHVDLVVQAAHKKDLFSWLGFTIKRLATA